MALWVYVCECGHKTKKITSDPNDSLVCASCGSEAKRQLPTNIATDIMETKDKLRGVQAKKDLDKKLKKRMTEHHDRNIHEKIDRYGLDDTLKFKWDKTAMGKKK